MSLATTLTSCMSPPDVPTAPTGTVSISIPPAPTSEPTAFTPAPGTTQRVVTGNVWSKNYRRQHAVADSALRVINKTPSGATVMLSMFNMTYPGAAATLIKAHRRGVKVRVVLNSEGTGSKQSRILIRALGRNTSARSWVVVRSRSIRMHSKFLLSSRSAGSSDVVWVSSGNLTVSDGRDQVNEALITTGDHTLYRFLAEQFTLLRKGVLKPSRLARHAATSTAIVQTFPLPVGGPENDPVVKLLQNIRCVNGSERTTIRVAHYFLTKQRLYLVDRFRNLKAAGCRVRLLAHLPGWEALVREGLARPGPGRIKLRSARGGILHTKVITVEGWDATGQPLDVAMVGTQNLSGRGITKSPEGVNDELTLTVRNPKTVGTYSAWIDMVIAEHSRPA